MCLGGLFRHLYLGMKPLCAPQVWGRKNLYCSCPNNSYTPPSTVSYCWALSLTAQTDSTGIPLRREKVMGKLAHSQLRRKVLGLCEQAASPGSFPGGSSSFPQPCPVCRPCPARPHGTGTERTRAVFACYWLTTVGTLYGHREVPALVL